MNVGEMLHIMFLCTLNSRGEHAMVRSEKAPVASSLPESVDV
jgi:hypothetical protein